VAGGCNQPLLPAGSKIIEFCIGDNTGGLPCEGVPEDDWTNPLLLNNIVWHNNSWYFNGEPGMGILEPNSVSPYWDLGVEGGSTGQVLEPQNAILSALIGPDGVSYAGNGNLDLDPDFVSEYDNFLEATTIIDEGGNNINIRFTPFPGSTEVNASDYHITDTSPAIEAGGAVTFVPSMPDLEALLANDFDDDPRPTGADTDIGADEYFTAAVLDDCPSDLDNSGTVNFADLALLKANFFTNCSELPAGQECVGDIVVDGFVNFADLAALKADFFMTCP
jgi:hypothetical protein